MATYLIACICVEEFLMCDPEQCHVFCLFQPQQAVPKGHSFQIKCPNNHLDGAFLNQN